jgi:predicted GIY-YIG superfamily endonuclease
MLGQSNGRDYIGVTEDVERQFVQHSRRTNHAMRAFNHSLAIMVLPEVLNARNSRPNGVVAAAPCSVRGTATGGDFRAEIVVVIRRMNTDRSLNRKVGLFL